MFLCKHWTSTKFARSELTVETLASSRYGEITLKSMFQTREMWLPYFVYIWLLNVMKMRWYSGYSLLLLLFRTNGKKGHLDENRFRRCYGNFFWKWHSESYLITAMFRVPSQQLRGTWTTAFWKKLYS